jgi:sugar-phosphatase
VDDLHGGEVERAAAYLLSLGMSQISCSALLFDLDGVLIDSTPAVERVWSRWAIEHGFDPNEVIQRAHGCPSIATIREYLPNANHEAENRLVEKAEIEDLGGVVPLPGAMEFLTSLPPHRWTIVTSCTRPLAEVRIRAAGLPVPKVIVTSNDIKNGKPHPEPYLKGASILGYEPTNCVVFEDVPAGIRAGKSAGMKVMAMRTTAVESELRKAGADWVVDDCAHVKLEGVSTEGLFLSIQE